MQGAMLWNDCDEALEPPVPGETIYQARPRRSTSSWLELQVLSVYTSQLLSRIRCKSSTAVFQVVYLTFHREHKYSEHSEPREETTAYNITSVGRQRFGSNLSLKSHPKDNPFLMEFSRYAWLLVLPYCLIVLSACSFQIRPFFIHATILGVCLVVLRAVRCKLRLHAVNLGKYLHYATHVYTQQKMGCKITSNVTTSALC